MVIFFSPFSPRVHFQLSSIRLRVTQSKMAQKFESASKLADLRWKFVENHSVIVFKFFKPRIKESKQRIILMHNVFLYSSWWYIVYILFIFSSRKAEAHKIKLFSELLQNLFVWNGTLKLQVQFLFLHKTIGSFFLFSSFWVNDWSLRFTPRPSFLSSGNSRQPTAISKECKMGKHLTKRVR